MQLRITPGSALNFEVGRLRATPLGDRQQVVDLQQMGRVAAAPGERIPIAAASSVALPDMAPNSRGNVAPWRGAPRSSASINRRGRPGPRWHLSYGERSSRFAKLFLTPVAYPAHRLALCRSLVKERAMPLLNYPATAVRCAAAPVRFFVFLLGDFDGVLSIGDELIDVPRVFHRSQMAHQYLNPANDRRRRQDQVGDDSDPARRATQAFHRRRWPSHKGCFG